MAIPTMAGLWVSIKKFHSERKILERMKLVELICNKNY